MIYLGRTMSRVLQRLTALLLLAVFLPSLSDGGVGLRAAPQARPGTPQLQADAGGPVGASILPERVRLSPSLEKQRELRSGTAQPDDDGGALLPAQAPALPVPGLVRLRLPIGEGSRCLPPAAGAQRNRGPPAASVAA
ncbi:hypothetical protein [Tistlia consotensis]|nr:hypothetical protein [Tistlia consotensis]